MIYLFSNIRITRAEVVLNNIQEGDTLVFINRANNYELFKDVKAKKILICRANCYGGGYHGREEWKGRELDYFDEFYIAEKIGAVSVENYPKDKVPTTGFALYRFYAKQGEVVLINFFPSRDHSTTHWEGHDWEWEQRELDDDIRKGKVKILDLR